MADLLVGYGITRFRYEQVATDSTSHFEDRGRRLSLELVFSPWEGPFSLVGGYTAATGEGGTEEARHRRGVTTSELESDISRFRLALGYGYPSPGRPTFRVEAGYRWIRIDLLRRGFRLNGAPIPGAPPFVSEHLRPSGFSLSLVGDFRRGGETGSSRSSLGFRFAGEGAYPLSAEVTDSRDASFDTEGLFWRAQAEVMRAAPSWSISLGAEHTSLRMDAAGPPPTRQGELSLGETDFRLTTYYLAWRARI